MLSGQIVELRAGIFWKRLALLTALIFVAAPLFAVPDEPKTVHLLFKSYQQDIADGGKYVFFITSSELPSSEGDWHPGMVDKNFKVGEMVGSFKIIKFKPMSIRAGADTWNNDKLVLLLESNAKPPVKVELHLGVETTVPMK